MTNGADEDPAWSARKLLRCARAGVLATATDGQPFASLVTPAAAPDGALLMLLSELSEHTRQLRVNPLCSMLLAGPAPSANPQTAPRLTLTGTAALAPDPALKARWLAVHPYASLYADFADFSLWRIEPGGALFVGGFARATRLRRAELAPDAAAVAALAAAEGDILTHLNDEHSDALAVIGRAAGDAAVAGGAGRWRMVAVDVDGCDLVREESETVVRVAWSAPASDAGAVRSELIALARAGRGL